MFAHIWNEEKLMRLQDVVNTQQRVCVALNKVYGKKYICLEIDFNISNMF